LGGQLDGAAPVLGNPLLGPPGLLVRVNVKREPVLLGVAPEPLEPVARAGPHGVGGDADADPRVAQLLEPAEVFVDRGLAEALDPASRVRRVEEHELDAGFDRGLCRGVCFAEPEVVELADGGVARGAQLAVDPDVVLADARRSLTPRQVQHGLAPGPEVLALVPAAQRPLKAVAL